ncbi:MULTISPECIES: alpha/beta hydrolase-fold protein [unclassified Brevibacterium]|uniref:alpha/beta hydrolase-fold protein n=1 Tax=unclassified Brevibacterium TaxID=2614124 RepID=UPI00109247AB|nr:alpha/beta hydrolase-fold protein [Brevibacterium sp. S22]TGD30215.1 hypothetical protein EB835_13965 [Brevibacterium sp. S22]
MSERKAESAEATQVERPAESGQTDRPTNHPLAGVLSLAQAGGPTTVQEGRSTPALCTWTDIGEAWHLRLVLPDSLIPAEAGLQEGEDVFADVNGITDRRDVPGGVMARRTGAPTGEGTATPTGEGTQGERSLELVVPRGFRGSLQFLPVPHTLQAADRPTWLNALERAFLPTGQHGLREVVDMRTQRTFELSAPDARPLIWTGGDEPESEPPVSSGAPPRPGIGSAGVSEQVVELDSTPRKIWTHRPDRAPASAPVLVVFDGERFIRGGLLAGIDELIRPPSVIIAIDHAPIAEAAPGSEGDGLDGSPVGTVRSAATDREAAADLRASDLVLNPRFCDDVLELVRDTAPEAPDRILVAGASYGGLAATYFALRHPDSFRGISLSPSYWQSDDQGRRIWDCVPDRAGGTEAPGQGESAGSVESERGEPAARGEPGRGEPAAHGEPGQGDPDARGEPRQGDHAARVDFCIDHGTLETVIAESAAEAVDEFAARGIEVTARPFIGGHEHLWWRELVLVRLAEILAE